MGKRELLSCCEILNVRRRGGSCFIFTMSFLGSTYHSGALYSWLNSVGHGSSSLVMYMPRKAGLAVVLLLYEVPSASVKH